MKSLDEDLKKIFVIDIFRSEINLNVSLTGYIVDKKNYGNGFYGIKVRDITGTVWCNTNERSIYNTVDKNSRINVLGQVCINSKGNKVIVIKSINTSQISNIAFSLLDDEMREQSAKMLMARILKKISNLLRDKDYIEFDSKLLSRYLPEDEGLEPLLVKYPGFGMPICLTISPSAQVIEFLQTTLSKCFTVSTSFCQSHRFPNSSHELKIVMAKSLNVAENDHEKLLIYLAEQVYKNVTTKDAITMNKYHDTWTSITDVMETNTYFLKDLPYDMNFICFEADIPVIGKQWNTIVKKIYHIVDNKGNILVEGARENISENSTICTVTLYPSQFLNLIQNAPVRQLTNLDRLFNGKRSR